MSGEYWVELENNHHYIIVDSINDRTLKTETLKKLKKYQFLRSPEN